MFKRVLAIGGILAVVALVAALVAVWALPGQAEARYGGRSNLGAGAGSTGIGGIALQPVAPIGLTPADLSASEAEALLMALQDEYRAWAVYDQVIADFGAVRPFTSIQNGEESHIAALVTLFERYDLEVPANEWLGTVPSFDTLADACEAGIQAETGNAALYDELFAMVDNADIVQVFTSLQRASETRHLPALERCAC